MGTRGDFYIGKGNNAVWIGSKAYDSYPDGIGAKILNSTTEEDFLKNVNDLFAEQSNQCTLPEQGWPWPWENSRTTDFSYWFSDGKVWASRFGSMLFDPLKMQDENFETPPKGLECPEMS